VAGELYAITTQDRGERVIAAYAAPLHKDQEINGVVALWHDVTELKRAEEAMRELSLQLTEEARRKDEFLAHLGHELRNPLVPIGNAVYLMRKAGPDRELLENACAIAEHQVAHIARLVDDLLDVSRIARGKVALKKEAVDLVQVMQGVVRDYQPVFAENQLALEVSLPQEPLWIEADRARVIQVASNLLQNAIKFTDPGGRVSLSVSVPEKGWSQVAVQDSGAGIPPRLLRSIFEPFMQSEATLGRARGGLGLGLALAKGLVELHGGTISARSDGPGLGAQFIVRLPAAPAVGQPETPAAQPAQAARRRRVLVVEDLPDAATTLRLLLEMAGHEVAVAHDGRAALEQAGSFGPEIILCDIGLPGDLDGYAVARAIRATPGLERTRLVAMTGFGSAGVRDKASLAGFDLTLIKPVEPEALVQVIAAEP
jgi:signal transduction histidine kinase